MKELLTKPYCTNLVCDMSLWSYYKVEWVICREVTRSTYLFPPSSALADRAGTNKLKHLPSLLPPCHTAGYYTKPY